MGNGLLNSILDRYVRGSWPFSPGVDEMVQIVIDAVTRGKRNCFVLVFAHLRDSGNTWIFMSLDLVVL